MSEIVTEKACTKCGKRKAKSNYNKCATTKDRLRPECKECQKKYSLSRYFLRREEYLELGRRWYANNKDKVKKRHREYRKKNIKKLLEYAKSWVKKNPDKAKAYSHKYLDGNREAVYERSRSYKAKHKDKVLEHSRTRRAREKNAGGKITVKEWRSVLDKYGNCCLCCGRSDVKLHMDHVVPLAIGGTNTADNVQPLCKSCNSKKFTKHIDYRIGVNNVK